MWFCLYKRTVDLSCNSRELNVCHCLLFHAWHVTHTYTHILQSIIIIRPIDTISLAILPRPPHSHHRHHCTIYGGGFMFTTMLILSRSNIIHSRIILCIHIVCGIHSQHPSSLSLPLLFLYYTPTHSLAFRLNRDLFFFSFLNNFTPFVYANGHDEKS